MKLFYVDTCIWLNLFKKEGDASKGVPYWKISEDFFKKCEKSNNLIFLSPFVLKEIESKMEDKFKDVEEFFSERDFIKIINANADDYAFARKLESGMQFSISFFDCMHISICKRMNLILVTRDKALLEESNGIVCAIKPEYLSI